MNKHNKTETELQIQRTNMWLLDTENKHVVARAEVDGGRREIGEGDYEIQTSSCKKNESQV